MEHGRWVWMAGKPKYPGRLPGYFVPKPKPMRVLLYTFSNGDNDSWVSIGIKIFEEN
jgi:hypothetical protein